MSIEGRRDAPDSPLSVAKLELLSGVILVKTVGRVRNSRMYTIVELLLKPIEAVGVEK